MSGSSYKHKSGAAKRKEKEKREQDKAKLQKLDTYFVRPPGDEPDIVFGRDSSPPKQPAQSGSQIYRYQFNHSAYIIHNV